VGESFTFVVNECRSLPRGRTGSQPIRSHAAERCRMEHLLRSAAETHQNMLRVWGGGFYEEERSMTCATGMASWCGKISCFPAARTRSTMRLFWRMCTLRQFRTSAGCGTGQAWHCGVGITRLSGCGCCVAGMCPSWRSARSVCRVLSHYSAAWCAAEIRAVVLAEFSLIEPALPGPNAQSRGDAHYWDVWHGRKPFTAYRTQFPRFMSEFGFQSLPPLDTIRTYADEADWNMTSYIMEHHQRSASGTAS